MGACVLNSILIKTHYDKSSSWLDLWGIIYLVNYRRISKALKKMPCSTFILDVNLMYHTVSFCEFLTKWVNSAFYIVAKNVIDDQTYLDVKFSQVGLKPLLFLHNRCEKKKYFVKIHTILKLKIKKISAQIWYSLIISSTISKDFVFKTSCKEFTVKLDRNSPKLELCNALTFWAKGKQVTYLLWICAQHV